MLKAGLAALASVAGFVLGVYICLILGFSEKTPVMMAGFGSAALLGMAGIKAGRLIGARTKNSVLDLLVGGLLMGLAAYLLLEFVS